MNRQDKLELIADYSFVNCPKITSINVKEYVDVWALLFQITVIDSNYNLKNRRLYEKSQKFIQDILSQCKENSALLNSYNQRVFELLIAEIELIIKKVKLNKKEIIVWQKYIEELTRLTNLC